MRKARISRRLSGFVIGLAVIGASASSAHAERSPDPVPLTVNCVAQAATYHSVPFKALVGILAVERGRVGQARANTNATHDMGPFQINTFWLDKLERFDIDREAVRYNGCANAFIAAWILAHQAESYPMWEAIGRYHSATPTHKERYIASVREALQDEINVHALVRHANRGL